MATKLENWNLEARVSRLRPILSDLTAQEAAEAVLILRRVTPRRSGRMARSYRVRRFGEQKYGVVSTHPGVHVQNDGRVLRPVRRRFLAWTNPKGRSGVFGNPKYVAIPSGGGHMVVVDRAKAGRRIHGFLRRQVRIPAQHFLERAAEELSRHAGRRITKEVTPVWTGAR